MSNRNIAPKCPICGAFLTPTASQEYGGQEEINYYCKRCKKSRKIKMVFKSVNLSQEAIDLIENYRRKYKGKIPSFSKVLDQIILDSELLTVRNKESK